VKRRVILLRRTVEVGLVVTVAVVLPVTVCDPALYLELAGPCLLAAAVAGWFDGRGRR
jgi:hypothetical protein